MNSEIIFKIVFFGDKEVGRRTLLKRAVNMFNYGEDYIETIGVDIYQKVLTLGSMVINLRIYNVSNKKTFRSLIPNYINGSDGALLMFDVTNLITLDFLSNYPRLIRAHAGEIPILLIGNKDDLGEERAVSEEGEKFARANDLLGYVEISAKSGQGCEGIFELLAKCIMSQLQIN